MPGGPASFVASAGPCGGPAHAAFVAQQRRTLSSLSKTAEKRYAEFRKLYPSLDGRVAQKHIASYLGMTPEFLSTVRKRVLAKG